MKQAIPLSLYVHLPWCVRKCPYCDFNSHVGTGPIAERAYVDALLSDLESQLPDVWGRGLDTVFIGGGTPSLFSPESIERLLAGIRARLRLRPDSEVTLEANPGTLEAGRFGGFRDAGINRLSIGVQSFHDPALKALGRIHDSAQARSAYALARDSGFERINIDLMFGLPGQSRGAALEDLRTALALGPEHLSWYQLTLEPNTPFHHSPPVLPDEDCIALIQRQGIALLAENGYRRYEISAFAKPGQQCRHNRNYWEFGDYLGIGAGAHGKLTLQDPFRIVRRHKFRGPDRYLASPQAMAGTRTVGAGELPLEFMLNALRLIDGVSVELYAARTGLATDSIAGGLGEARRRGLLDESADRIRPSALGSDFLNDLLAIFM